MNLEIIEHQYNPRKQLFKIKAKINHHKYDSVLCMFHLKRKNEEAITLSQAFVEDMMIPPQEHQELLLELRNNNDLFDIIRDISGKIIKNEPKILKEEKLKKSGNLTLDYLSVLAASSAFTKTIKRQGSKLSTVFENENSKHKLFIMVKFKELEDEYELKVTFFQRAGTRYKVRLTNSPKNKNKLNINEFLSEEVVNNIVRLLRKKVDFLP